jgi:hypothetical protein
MDLDRGQGRRGVDKGQHGGADPSTCLADVSIGGPAEEGDFTNSAVPERLSACNAPLIFSA